MSLRELRKLRRVADKAEIVARSKAALVRALIKSRPPIQQPQPQFQHLPQPPAPVPLVPTPTPNQASSGSAGAGAPWLWCGVVRSGWGTPTNGEEDLLLMMYQADGQIFLVPALLSALGVPPSIPNLTPDTGSSLVGLLPPLWDGTPHTPIKLDPSVHPYPDFLLHTSTPDAPPLALHRSILSARSIYFDSLLRSGFSEARTGEASIEEGYDAAYALCYWIYANSLPTWLESPNTYSPSFAFPPSPSPSSSSYFPSLKETELFRLEAQYASHAASTLCDLLTAASARMLPALAMRARSLIRAEHMRLPEVAPIVWRAAEITDVDEGEDLVRVGQEGSRSSQEFGMKGISLVQEVTRSPNEKQGSEDWVYDVVRSRMRPAEDRRQFMSAVSAWCCDSGNTQVRAVMEGAKEWLETGVWNSWLQRCAKVEKERDVAMGA